MSDLAVLPPPDDEEAQSRPDMDHAELLRKWISAVNIADELEDSERSLIAQRVLRDYDMDDATRAEWKEKYAKWMDFAMQIAQQKTYPWPGASNVIWPLMTSAAIQFSARAYPAIVRDKDVVKGAIEGSDNGIPLPDPRTGAPVMRQGPDGKPQPVWLEPPGIKKERADKIGQHMSWQLLEEQEEWEPQTDKLLIILPIVGVMFRKSYFDPGMQRNVSETVSALNLCVNYKAKSFETAPRVSEIVQLYPWEIEEKIRSGVFLDEDYGQDQDSGMDEDAPTTFIEQHRRWDLDDDGYPEPYIVTVARDGGKLARIKAAYDEEGVHFSKSDHRVRKIDPISYYTKYGFIPSPDSGVYDIGFGNLLFPINEAINSSLNQLFDAGHLANAGGGFVGSAMSMNTGAVRFQLGEYKPVNVTGATIRDSIFPIPFPGPNVVLFQLLQFLVEAGKEIASVKDVMVGDLPGDNTSGVATLAMIEQGLKVFSAIYKRIHRSLKQEYRKLFRLNRLYLPQQAGYRRGNQWHEISQKDYQQGAGVEPVSDPQMVTDMQKLGRAQFLMGFKDDPWFKGRDIRQRMLDAAMIPDGEALLVDQPPPNPALGVKVGELQLKQHDIELRDKELSIRAAREEGDLDIRRGKDKAQEVEMYSRVVLNLANARKADHETNQGWYDLQIKHYQSLVEAANASAERNPTADSPAAAGGVGGTNPGTVGNVAPAPGNAGVPPVPPGLPANGATGGPGAMGQGGVLG